MGSACTDACPLCSGLWSGASYADATRQSLRGAVILAGEIDSKEIDGSIRSVMKGSQVFRRK